MMKEFLLLACLLTTFSGITQEEPELDEACTEVSKKTKKILDEIPEATSLADIVGLFDKAIEKEPEKAEVYFRYGLFCYDQAMSFYETEASPVKGDRSLETAKKQFLKVVELCPEYHAEAYYSLGVCDFFKGRKDEAMTWFQRFLDFESDDNDRYPNNYTKMVSDVKLTMKDYQEEKAFYENVVPFEPFKVKNVSTATNEYFPMISPDNELMFFTRTMDRSNLGDIVTTIREEFTYAQRPNLNAEFDRGQPFDLPFNDGSFESYGAATMSVDNQEIILCACKNIDIMGQTYKNCDLYEASYSRSGQGGNDYQWSPLKNLGPNINTADGWEGQPSLSADGQRLYFTALRKTTNDNDIYYSDRQPDGSWGPARPFNEVNTYGKDKSPFIHQDGETFYFVSESTDQRRGAGGLDIFYIRQKEDGSWGEPKNIGVPINTPGDELGIFVSAEGSIAYYSSRQQSGWDIYGFELYVEARPKSVVILKGQLETEDGEIPEGANVEVSYSEDGTKQKFKVREDGKYAAVVKAGKKQDVMVAVNQPGAAMDAKVIPKEDLTQVTERKEVSIKGKDLKVERLEEGRTYEIEDILYATNSAEINGSSLLILRGFADFLKSNASIQIQIVGHTDDVGDADENLDLSQRRAEKVKNFLIAQGVQANRLTAIGKGESAPKMENVDEWSRAQNRRTEFVITKL